MNCWLVGQAQLILTVRFWAPDKHLHLRPCLWMFMFVECLRSRPGLFRNSSSLMWGEVRWGSRSRSRRHPTPRRRHHTPHTTRIHGVYCTLHSVGLLQSTINRRLAEWQSYFKVFERLKVSRPEVMTSTSANLFPKLFCCAALLWPCTSWSYNKLSRTSCVDMSSFPASTFHSTNFLVSLMKCKWMAMDN